jgi:hypothetical protein
MKHKRKWPCAVCGKDLIYDDKTKTLTCGCNTEKCTFVNLSMFQPITGS